VIFSSLITFKTRKMKILLTALMAFVAVSLFGQTNRYNKGTTITKLSIYDACIDCVSDDQQDSESDQAIDDLISDLQDMAPEDRTKDGVRKVLNHYDRVFQSTSFDYTGGPSPRGVKGPSSRGITKAVNPTKGGKVSDAIDNNKQDEMGNQKPLSDDDAANILADAAPKNNTIPAYTKSRGATTQPVVAKRMYLKGNTVLQIDDLDALDCGGDCDVTIDVTPVTDDVKDPYVAVTKNGERVAGGSGKAKVDDVGSAGDAVTPSAYIFGSGVYQLEITRTAKSN